MRHGPLKMHRPLLRLRTSKTSAAALDDHASEALIEEGAERPESRGRRGDQSKVRPTIDRNGCRHSHKETARRMKTHTAIGPYDAISIVGLLIFQLQYLT